MRYLVSIVCLLIFVSTVVMAGGHREEGEESGRLYSLDQTHDEVRRGMRLVLEYDAASGSFRGSVTNTTDRAIGCVRVEAHLSNGVELGPTPRVDLGPGITQSVELDARDGHTFESWSAHPESGCGKSKEHDAE